MLDRWEEIIMDYRRAMDSLVLETCQSLEDNIPEAEIIRCSASVANEQQKEQLAIMCAVMMTDMAKRARREYG